DEAGGIGALWFPVPGLQNGAPDGLALLDADDDAVLFLSYEGLLTAADGPLAGETSSDLGVQESGTTPVGHALPPTATGRAHAGSGWRRPAPAPPGTLTAGQQILSQELSDGPVFAPLPLSLSPAAPTPYHAGTHLTLRLEAPQHATVAVYDALGRRVALLHD